MDVLTGVDMITGIISTRDTWAGLIISTTSITTGGAIIITMDAEDNRGLHDEVAR
jgi:hypothetical protein